MIKQLIKLANHLDNKGFIKEADYLDAIIKKAFQAGLDEFDDQAPESMGDKATDLQYAGYPDAKVRDLEDARRLGLMNQPSAAEETAIDLVFPIVPVIRGAAEITEALTGDDLSPGKVVTACGAILASLALSKVGGKFFKRKKKVSPEEVIEQSYRARNQLNVDPTGLYLDRHGVANPYEIFTSTDEMVPDSIANKLKSSWDNALKNMKAGLTVRDVGSRASIKLYEDSISAKQRLKNAWVKWSDDAKKAMSNNKSPMARKAEEAIESVDKMIEELDVLLKKHLDTSKMLPVPSKGRLPIPSKKQRGAPFTDEPELSPSKITPKLPPPDSLEGMVDPLIEDAVDYTKTKGPFGRD